MTKESGVDSPLIIRHTRSSEEFITYCEGEFDRRMNSGEAFDEAGFREAMAIALDKLRKLEEGA